MAADLFSTPKTPHRIGYGNALFLADIAEGASLHTLRENAKAGRYPNLSPSFARNNINFRRIR